MPWRVSDDSEEYAQRALPLLEAHAAEHTLALTVLDAVRSGHRFSSEPPCFAWLEEGGRVTGAASMTPPFELLLAEVPDPTVGELAAALRAAGIAVPGAHGDPAVAHRIDITGAPIHGRRLDDGAFEYTGR
jgi:hypothetical protein